MKGAKGIMILIGFLGVIWFASTQLGSTPFDGYTFGIREVERQCTVTTKNRRDGFIVCKNPEMKPIERRCEVIFEGATESIITVQCRDKAFLALESCKVKMSGVKTGNLSCTKSKYAPNI